MRRERLEAAINRVTRDLEDTGMLTMLEATIETLQRAGSPDRGLLDWFSINVVTEYIRLVSDYEEEERAVLSTLEIERLSDPAWWQAQLREVEPSVIYPMIQRVRTAISILPKIVVL